MFRKIHNGNDESPQTYFYPYFSKQLDKTLLVGSSIMVINTYKTRNLADENGKPLDLIKSNITFH